MNALVLSLEVHDVPLWAFVIRLLAITSSSAALTLMVMVLVVTWRARNARIPVPSLTFWHVLTVSICTGGYLTWGLYEVGKRLFATAEVAAYLSPLVFIFSTFGAVAFWIILKLLTQRGKNFKKAVDYNAIS